MNWFAVLISCQKEVSKVTRKYRKNKMPKFLTILFLEIIFYHEFVITFRLYTIVTYWPLTRTCILITKIP